MLEPYSTWEHVKTGSYYTVIGEAGGSTNGEEDREYVVYLSHKYQKLRVRLKSEFLDGRFRRLPCAV